VFFVNLFHLRRWLSIFGVIFLLLIGWGTISPNLASAHAEYDHSAPQDGAVLAQSPAEVHVWFTEELFRREGANTLAVFGPSGTQVDQGDARIDDDDRTRMLVSLNPGLPDGQYTVRWQSLSLDDGDEDSGEFSFTIGLVAAAAPAETQSATDMSAAGGSTAPEPDTSNSSSLPCLSGLIMTLLTLGMVIVPSVRKSERL